MPLEPIDIKTLGLPIARAAAPFDRQVHYVADEPLSALRVVRLASVGRVRIARPPELEASAPIGVTAAATSTIGGAVVLCTAGELQDPAFAFTPGMPVLLGLDGALTQVPPAGIDLQVVIGWAIAIDTIIVRIEPAIQLAPAE